MISEHRQRLRQGRVTASIVPAILGLDKYKSPLQAFLEITGRVKGTAGHAAEVGQFFEDAVLRLWEHKSGKKIKRRNVWRVCPDLDLGATLDAVVDGEPWIIEAKTTGIASYGNLEDWGEEGTDQVPERVLIQTAAQMIAAPEMEGAYVPLVGGGVGFRGYVVPKNPELCGLVHQGVEQFIVDFLEKDVAPPPDHRDLELVEARKRTSGAAKRIAEENVLAYLRADEAFRAAEEAKDAARAALLDELGDAEIGECDAATVTYRKCKDGTRFDEKAFAGAHPDLYNQFLRTRPGYRTLRVKMLTAAAAGIRKAASGVEGGAS